MTTFASLLMRLKDKGCADTLLSRFSNMLPSHDPKYTEALFAWATQGDKRLLSSQGVSTRDIMRDLGVDYPNAVSMIIWIEDDPENALSALNTGIDQFMGGDAHD